METVYHHQLVEGMSIPAIVHNGSYFLIQMAVYENGTVSCWHKSDLGQFQGDLEKGWVVPDIPDGEELSVHGLGSFPVRKARWRYNSQGFYRHVEEIVRLLNPEMANLYRTTRRELDKWNQARVQWAASPTPCKHKEGLGYRLLDGDSCYLFFRQDKALHLTPLTVYSDQTIRIGAAGDRFYTMEEINALFTNGILTTSPREEEWVILEGLGEILLAPAAFGTLPACEKQKEIADTISRLAGEEDSLDRCMKAHYQYLTDPSDWAREALRKAYEAVPEHQRMFLGDMDTRDSDFIRILCHPEEKREV